MPAIVINGVTYNGSGSNPNPPDADGGIEVTPRRMGRTLVAANGSRSFVLRGGAVSQKREFALTWTNADLDTRTAVLALGATTGTITYTDEFGTSFTVQVEEEDIQTSTAFAKSDNTMLYNLSLTLHEA